jgi:hypothetical protein
MNYSIYQEKRGEEPAHRKIAVVTYLSFTLTSKNLHDDGVTANKMAGRGHCGDGGRPAPRSRSGRARPMVTESRMVTGSGLGAGGEWPCGAGGRQQRGRPGFPSRRVLAPWHAGYRRVPASWPPGHRRASLGRGVNPVARPAPAHLTGGSEPDRPPAPARLAGRGVKYGRGENPCKLWSLPALRRAAGQAARSGPGQAAE